MKKRNLLYSPQRAGYNYLKVCMNLAYNFEYGYPLDYEYKKKYWKFSGRNLYKEIPYKVDKHIEPSIYHTHKGDWNENTKDILNKHRFKTAYLLRNIYNIIYSQVNWRDSFGVYLKNTCKSLEYWNRFYKMNEVHLVKYEELMINKSRKIREIKKLFNYYNIDIKDKSISNTLKFTTKSYMSKLIPDDVKERNERVTYRKRAPLTDEQIERITEKVLEKVDEEDLLKALEVDNV